MSPLKYARLKSIFSNLPVTEIEFKLPLPPSVNNNSWVGKRRNRKTGEMKPCIIKKDSVRKWKEDAEILLRHIKPQVETDWELNINFVFYYVKKPRKCDSDNRLKPLFDALARRIAIDDSRLCKYTVTREFKKGKEDHYVTGSVILL